MMKITASNSRTTNRYGSFVHFQGLEIVSVEGRIRIEAIYESGCIASVLSLSMADAQALHQALGEELRPKIIIVGGDH